MIDYKFEKMLVVMFGYMGFSFLMFFFLERGMSVWLGINVFLAMIPLILISLLHKRMFGKYFKFDWLSVLYLIGFIIFFPNTFYVITDLIHIVQSEYYVIDEYLETMVYIREIGNYVFIFQMLLTVVTGVFVGIKSILRFDDLLRNLSISDVLRNVFVFLLIFLSSIGIYIGRFLRFFSWDLINPFKVIAELIGSFDSFAFWFILLFIVIQYTMYYGYRSFISEEPF